jgi:hypothetical protein
MRRFADEEQIAPIVLRRHVVVASVGWCFTTRSFADVEIANVFTIACDAQMEH